MSGRRQSYRSGMSDAGRPARRTEHDPVVNPLPVEFEDPPTETRETKVPTVKAAKVGKVPGARRRS